MTNSKFSPSAQLKLNYAGRSLTGLRPENQDAFLVKSPAADERSHKGIAACIADGVSCSENSQQASHTASMQFILDYYATPQSWSIKHAAGKVLNALNTWLYEEGSKQDLAHNGFVTTFSAVIFKFNTAHIFHAGDTRIYRLRAGKLRLLTKDHQRTALGKPAYLTRALGIDSKLEIDYQKVSLKQGDRFILSTDGVHDYIDASDLSELVQVKPDQDLDDLSRHICQYALNNNSQDNSSCLILDVSEVPAHTLLEHQQLTLSRTIPPALAVGNVLDDYRVNKILHAGSRSHVYLVTEQSSDQEMVMKVPSAQYSDDLDSLINFSNEYWIGSQLDSDRVMRMFPKPQNSKFTYQLCEWLNGITLRQWMYDNPQPSLAQVRHILSEVIKAVRVFQRADMVHRDLKPENIMMTDSGSVKIIDLGAVKAMGLDEMSADAKESVPLGAINYIAPEYINTGKATTHSDLFSVAVIGYEMLCGELPYKAKQNQNLQMAQNNKWHYRPLSLYRDDLPSWLDLAFKKATQAQPQLRYQVLSEFVMDLYTPNQALQNELKNSPLLQRNPLLFWKACALVALGTAIVELLLLLTLK